MPGEENVSADKQELLETANKLALQFDQFNASVDKATAVRDELRTLRKTGSTNRRFIVTLALSFVLDFALTIVLAVVANNQMTSTDRLDELTSQLNAEVTTQKVLALCPLYQLFINADIPQARESAGARGDNLEDRDKAFAVIHQSYDALRCKDFIGEGK